MDVIAEPLLTHCLASIELFPGWESNEPERRAGDSPTAARLGARLGARLSVQRSCGGRALNVGARSAVLIRVNRATSLT